MKRTALRLALFLVPALLLPAFDAAAQDLRRPGAGVQLPGGQPGDRPTGGLPGGRVAPVGRLPLVGVTNGEALTVVDCVRAIQGTSLADRLARFVQTANTTQTQTNEPTVAEEDGETDPGTTAPTVAVRTLVSRAEADLPRVGHPGVRLSRAHLSAEIWNNVAACTFQIDWVNQTTRNAEATYYLPVAPGTIFTGLELSIRSSMEEGSFEDFERANETYENIVRRSMDPAILEMFRTDVARLRVFPCEPGQVKRVRVRWLQLLDYADGKLNFAFPTDLHKYLGYSTGSFATSLKVNSSFPTRITGKGLVAGWTGSGSRSNFHLSPRSFARLGDEVAFAIENRQPARGFSDMMQVGDAENGGYFLATAYTAPAGQAPGMSLSVRADGVYLGQSLTREISSRSWGDAESGIMTLYVGRYDAAKGFEGGAPGSRASAAKDQPKLGVAAPIRKGIQALWAGQQMESISENLGPNDVEQAQELQRLGQENGVMTPFSALLVLEPGVR